MAPPAAVPSADDRDLAREGYQPLFLRGLGSFTAFAAGFSYLSILTGIVQNFYLGYRGRMLPVGAGQEDPGEAEGERLAAAKSRLKCLTLGLGQLPNEQKWFHDPLFGVDHR